MSDISGALLWPGRVLFLVVLIFLARRILMLWVPVPHFLVTVGLALALWGALWLIGSGLQKHEGDLRRPYEPRLRR